MLATPVLHLASQTLPLAATRAAALSSTPFAPLATLLTPELILIVTACVLFLLGCSSKVGARRLAPLLALLALLAVFILELNFTQTPSGDGGYRDAWDTLHVFPFAHYIKMLTAGIGFLLALLSWPSNRDATGNSAQNFGQESGEFFALMLLSISGVFLVASANDMILLFLGIELASIPTYIMVAISRPLPVAQEAGVKYFFLGALAAALMLFGFSYLYGTTGTTNLNAISQAWHAGVAVGSAPALTSWQMLAVIMLIVGFAFKMAAVPLHFYAGDVYQGAATPVTAFLSFVPKTSGFVALVKILAVVGGASWVAPQTISKLIWILAILTMSVGNVLGLLQYNIKRLLAYSSIAHSGYMLVGIAALIGGHIESDMIGTRKQGLEGVLFYLAAYGIMNAGAFAVLMLLPAGDSFEHGFRRRGPAPATSAETFEDIAGQGRQHVGLGLAMTVCCFSLIGLPLTVGFFGKLFLIRAALNNAASYNHMIALVVILVINAAVSAAYYLRIVGTMFLRPRPTPIYGTTTAAVAPTGAGHEAELPDSQQMEQAMEAGTDLAEDSSTSRSPAFMPQFGGASTAGGAALAMRPSRAVVLALLISVVGTLFFGIILPGTDLLVGRATASVTVDNLPGKVLASDLRVTAHRSH